MIIDIMLLLFGFGGFWLGYTRGIVATLISIVSYLVAVLLTLKFSPWLMDFLISTFKMGKLFALIFGTIGFLILVIVLIHWLVRRAENYLKKSKLTTLSKVMGGVVMLLAGMLVFSFFLWPLSEFGMVGEKSTSSSFSYTILETVPGKTKSFIEEFKPLFSRYWELMQETIQESKAAGEG